MGSLPPPKYTPQQPCHHPSEPPGSTVNQHCNPPVCRRNSRDASLEVNPSAVPEEKPSDCCGGSAVFLESVPKGGHARAAADVIIPAFSSELGTIPSTLPPSPPSTLPLSATRSSGFRAQLGGKWPVSRQTLVPKQQFTCHGPNVAVS